MLWTCSENRAPKAESKPLGRYTRHAGDTHDTESLLQCREFDAPVGQRRRSKALERLAMEHLLKERHGGELPTTAQEVLDLLD